MNEDIYKSLMEYITSKGSKGSSCKDLQHHLEKDYPKSQAVYLACKFIITGVDREDVEITKVIGSIKAINKEENNEQAAT